MVKYNGTLAGVELILGWARMWHLTTVSPRSTLMTAINDFLTLRDQGMAQVFPLIYPTYRNPTVWKGERTKPLVSFRSGTQL